MDDVNIRAAAAHDLDGIVGVIEHSGVARERVREWITSGAVRVAEIDGAIIGFAVSEPTFFGEEFVEMLHISSRARRRGAASRLLRVLSAERRTEKLFTSTNLSNTAMQSVLRGLGWESVGIVYGLDEGDPELFYIAPAR